MPAALVPLGPVTRTETVPPAPGPGGTTTFIVKLETTVNEVATVEPKATAVVFVKLAPPIDTVLPPAAGPLLGVTLLTTGAAAYVYVVPAALVPPGPVTRTEPAPPALGPGGTTAFIVESETTMNEVAIVEPKATAVAFVNPEPFIETVFPPETGPEEGLTFVMVGAGIVDTAASTLNENLSFFSSFEVYPGWRSPFEPVQN